MLRTRIDHPFPAIFSAPRDHALTILGAIAVAMAVPYGPHRRLPFRWELRPALRINTAVTTTPEQELVLADPPSPQVVQVSLTDDIWQPDRRDDSSIIKSSLRSPDGFAELFDRHAAVLHRYVDRRLGSEHAEDMVAETFTRAFEKRHRYDFSRPEALPWLYGIATNVIGGHRRAEMRGYRALARTGEDPVAVAFDEQVIARVSASAIRRRLAAALAKLGRGERDVLLRSEVRQSDPGTLYRARNRVLAAMTPPPPRRRPRPVMLSLAGAGALGLTVALGATLVSGSDGTGPRDETISVPEWAPVANVKTLAESATREAAKVTDVYPRDDQWFYVRAQLYVSGKESPSGKGRKQDWERWRRGDGKRQARRENIVHPGEVPPVAAHLVVVSSVEKPQWHPAYLRSLPLDPKVLRERLLKDSEDDPSRSEELRVFRQVQMILQESAPPPRLRAALYTVVSKLEGVRVEEQVEDLVGRKGVGIYLDGDSEDGTRYEFIVDPNDHVCLGGRSIFIGDGEPPQYLKGDYAKGDVIFAWAQTARGIVDRPGDRP